jgi:hypothetical protein
MLTKLASKQTRIRLSRRISLCMAATE